MNNFPYQNQNPYQMPIQPDQSQNHEPNNFPKKPGIIGKLLLICLIILLIITIGFVLYFRSNKNPNTAGNTDISLSPTFTYTPSKTYTPETSTPLNFKNINHNAINFNINPCVITKDISGEYSLIRSADGSSPSADKKEQPIKYKKCEFQDQNKNDLIIFLFEKPIFIDPAMFYLEDSHLSPPEEVDVDNYLGETQVIYGQDDEPMGNFLSVNDQLVVITASTYIHADSLADHILTQ